jgi:hypothetical protein
MMHRASTYFALIAPAVLAMPAAFLSGETPTTAYDVPCPKT